MLHWRVRIWTVKNYVEMSGTVEVFCMFSLVVGLGIFVKAQFFL